MAILAMLKWPKYLNNLKYRLMKLIDKDAALAVIDKRINQIATGITEIPLTGREKADATLEREVLGKVRSLIDTLEVKGVDLDFAKEVDMWIKYNEDTSGFFDVQELAKHFFELGIKASNSLEADTEIEQRIKECPLREVICNRYEDNPIECDGRCSWVVDYPKLKQFKAQKGEEV